MTDDRRLARRGRSLGTPSPSALLGVRRLLLAFDKALSEEGTLEYLMMLTRFTDPQIEGAVKNLIEDEDYFPSVSKVRKACEYVRGPIDTQGDQVVGSGGRMPVGKLRALLDGFYERCDMENGPKLRKVADRPVPWSDKNWPEDV
jgi:hypothetical protein